MSTIQLAFGQSGAEVARHYWQLAAKEAEAAAEPIGDRTRRGGPLFDARRATARALVIDGDDRALAGCQKLGGKTPVFDPDNVVTARRRGCGKNFSEGWTARDYLAEMTEERMRREAERCARVGTLAFLFSVEGAGTARKPAFL